LIPDVAPRLPQVSPAGQEFGLLSEQITAHSSIVALTPTQSRPDAQAAAEQSAPSVTVPGVTQNAKAVVFDPFCSSPRLQANPPGQLEVSGVHGSEQNPVPEPEPRRHAAGFAGVPDEAQSMSCVHVRAQSPIDPPTEPQTAPATHSAEWAQAIPTAIVPEVVPASGAVPFEVPLQM
jgi:hypothetical protein